MIEFTSEMLNTLTEAHNKVKGTTDFRKYIMETDCKSGNGKWFFVGHSVPNSTGAIKTVNGKTYIMTEEHTAKTRYHVTDEVRELLDI